MIQHNILKCSNCEKDLADVIVTREDEKLPLRFIANCPFCKDHSFIKEVHGIVSVGGTNRTRLLDLETNIIDNILTTTIILEEKPDDGEKIYS